MSAQRYTPDHIAQAEERVTRIQGISSCRISIDSTGDITEVHVVATTRKSPKLVARDVETCLAAEMGMTVDYKKIGVVVLDVEETPEQNHEPDRNQAAPIMEFPLDEFPSRFAFQSVNLFLSQESVQAEVELVRDGVETFGNAKSENLGAPHSHLVAEATLKAIGELLDEKIRLWLADVVEVQLGKDTAVVVKVNLLRNREGRSLAGCSLYAGNVNQTVVFATLDAVNRVLGKIRPKSSIEYKIR